MKTTITTILALIIGFASGYLLKPDTVAATSIADKSATGPSPAFLVGAARITDYERLPEYRALAEPLARKGGYTVLAAAKAGEEGAVLLEGEWPAPGLLFIERYDSMEKLLTFVESEEFQQAKVLRDQVAEVFFMFALDGGERGTSH